MSVVLSIFYQNLVKHVRVIVQARITWSPMRLSTRGFIKILPLEMTKLWTEITRRFKSRMLVDTNYRYMDSNYSVPRKQYVQ